MDSIISHRPANLPYPSSEPWTPAFQEGFHFANNLMAQCLIYSAKNISPAMVSMMGHASSDTAPAIKFVGDKTSGHSSPHVRELKSQSQASSTSAADAHQLIQASEQVENTTHSRNQNDHDSVPASSSESSSHLTQTGLPTRNQDVADEPSPDGSMLESHHSLNGFPRDGSGAPSRTSLAEASSENDSENACSTAPQQDRPVVEKPPIEEQFAQEAPRKLTVFIDLTADIGSDETAYESNSGAWGKPVAQDGSGIDEFSHEEIDFVDLTWERDERSVSPRVEPAVQEIIDLTTDPDSDETDMNCGGNGKAVLPVRETTIQPAPSNLARPKKRKQRQNLGEFTFMHLQSVELDAEDGPKIASWVESRSPHGKMAWKWEPDRPAPTFKEPCSRTSLSTEKGDPLILHGDQRVVKTLDPFAVLNTRYGRFLNIFHQLDVYLTRGTVASNIAAQRGLISIAWANGTRYMENAFVDTSTLTTCPKTTTGTWTNNAGNITWGFSASKDFKQSVATIKSPTINGIFKLKSRGPPIYPGGLVYPDSRASVLLAPEMYWQEQFPVADAEVHLSIRGTAFDLYGVGGRDKNWNSRPWAVISGKWDMARAIAGPYGLMLWNYTSAVDGRPYFSATLTKGNKVIFRTANQESLCSETYGTVMLAKDGPVHLSSAPGTKSPLPKSRHTGYLIDLVSPKTDEHWRFALDFSQTTFWFPASETLTVGQFAGNVSGGLVGGRQYKGVASGSLQEFVL
ncbi:hypothetical protein ACJ41O_013078 [Fusarium nematophilum]